MNATAPLAHPMQLADPRNYALMVDDFNTSQMLRKKADEWDEAHGFKYHLLTVGLILTTGLFGILIALGRTNPYRSGAEIYFSAYERRHDEIAKAHGMATKKELSRYVMRGTIPPARPAQARRPSARATLAA